VKASKIVLFGPLVAVLDLNSLSLSIVLSMFLLWWVRFGVSNLEKLFVVA